MVDTLVFIDDGFLSKLSKFFGDGEYLKLYRKDFAEFISKRENLSCKKIFVYTAPPFQNEKSAEGKRKKGYDKFVKSLIDEGVIVREGRCQRIKIGEDFVYSQKGVDTLLVMDLVKIPFKYKDVKKIILVASDSDFVPIIKDLQNEGIKIILYTYFNKKRKAKFSTSNELIKSVHKYVKLTKKDFEDIKK